MKPREINLSAIGDLQSRKESISMICVTPSIFTFPHRAFFGALPFRL
jgi:hypothetical protein